MAHVGIKSVTMVLPAPRSNRPSLLPIYNFLHKSNYQSSRKAEQTFSDLQDSKKFNSHTSFSQATNTGCAPSDKRNKPRKNALDQETGDPTQLRC